MRYSIPVFFLAGALAAVPVSLAQSSFGPEISAEDFHQHLANLAAFGPDGNRSDDYAEPLRLAYLKYQFIRLGMQNQPASCTPSKHSLQAVLPGTEAGARAVVYMAQWQKPAEIAAALEIAERFMTQRPRPRHDVVFLFSPSSRTDLAGCALLAKAKAVIQPVDMETRDASSMVRDLNILQRQGK
jgi:hypothetical protein